MIRQSGHWYFRDGPTTPWFGPVPKHRVEELRDAGFEMRLAVDRPTHEEARALEHRFDITPEGICVNRHGCPIDPRHEEGFVELMREATSYDNTHRIQIYRQRGGRLCRCITPLAGGDAWWEELHQEVTT